MEENGNNSVEAMKKLRKSINRNSRVETWIAVALTALTGAIAFAALNGVFNWFE